MTIGLIDNPKALITWLKNRDPSERYDTIIIQKDGRTVYEHFVRGDGARIDELIAMMPLK